jgi:hypothetical protein
MTRNEEILVAAAQRTSVALESIALSANTIANVVEEIRIELKKKRFDDADRENGK